MSSEQKPETTEVASPQETRGFVFERVTRRGAPIRSSFIQEVGGSRSPGPLHLFVQERRLFALNLYLLLHCLALGDPWDVKHFGGVWARALNHTNMGSESTVSRSWAWLSSKQLVTTRRTGRKLQVSLLDEGGRGAERTRPGRHFFTLPNTYFLNEWFDRLNLAETATLLVCLDQERGRAWFDVRPSQVSTWTGLSAATLRRGLDGLREKDVLAVDGRVVKDPSARFGTTSVNFYRLAPDFTAVLDPDPDE